jgi:hypothetical protein
MAHVSIQYGHWGITVSQRHSDADYAPFETRHFGYPVINGRGPMDSAQVEKDAMEYCRSLGGEVKGPFFR